MKNLLFCLLGLCLFIPQTIAQKVKLKDLDVKANIQKLPSIGLPADATTYFVDVEADASALQTLGYTKKQIEDAIKIQGYSKIQENVGAGVYLSLEGPSGAPLKLQKNDKKNKKGETWTEYHYTVNFTGSLKRKVVDQNGNTISEKIEQYNETKKTGTYRSLSALKKNFDSKKFYISNRSSALGSLIQNTAKRVRWEYAFVTDKKKVEFKRLNSKKHPKYATFLETEAITKTAFEAMTPYDNSKFKELIAPALEVWLAEEPGLSGKDKQQKKLKFLCQLNASLAYLYSSDFDNALKYAQMIQNGNEKQKKGKKLVKEITELQENLDRLGIETRFFKIEMDEAVAEEMQKVQEERQEAIASGDIREFPDFDDKVNLKRESVVVKGKSINLSGHETEGYWVYEQTYFDGPDFREPKKIRFGYLKDGEIKVGTPNFGKLSQVQFGDKIYTVDDVKLGSGLTGLKVKNAVIETLHDFDRTAIVRIFPSFKKGRAYGQTNDTEAAVAVYDKEEEKFKNIRSLRSRAKTIQKIVDDCDSAKEVAATEFKSKGGLLSKIGSQNEDNIPALIKVMEEYDKCKTEMKE